MRRRESTIWSPEHIGYNCCSTACISSGIETRIQGELEPNTLETNFLCIVLGPECCGRTCFICAIGQRQTIVLAASLPDVHVMPPKSYPASPLPNVFDCILSFQ